MSCDVRARNIRVTVREVHLTETGNIATRGFKICSPTLVTHDFRMGKVKATGWAEHGEGMVVAGNFQFYYYRSAKIIKLPETLPSHKSCDSAEFH